MNIDAPSRSQIPALRTLWQEAFGDTDDFLDMFFSTAFATDRCRCITTNDKVVAALYWFECQYMGKSIAYIYAVATAKASRGQGLCHQLMENTHQQLGYEAALLVPGSQKLFQFYERMGYKTCSGICTFDCGADEKTADLAAASLPCHSSDNAGISLRQIGKSEFAKLRRAFLPAGSVIQEKEHLDFLEKQANFYAGDGFLLVASGNGDTLFGIELLVDENISESETSEIAAFKTLASKILSSLGYQKGTFRTPVQIHSSQDVRTSCKEVTFAMYYPLGTSELAPPDYFGFAFD